jgi:hypothetical protein
VRGLPLKVMGMTALVMNSSGGYLAGLTAFAPRLE